MLTAISADGASFTYVSKLASSEGYLQTGGVVRMCMLPSKYDADHGYSWCGGYVWTHGVDDGVGLIAFINVRQYGIP
jgi:hypothetical protein